MPHADLTDVRINYRVDGPPDAPWLTMSNSLGCDLDLWDPQLPALAARFRVLRYDTRGHGASSAPPPPPLCTMATLGGDVIALLDLLGIERTHFCGISMGGLTGIWLALHASSRLDRLALCNTAGRIGVAEAWNARISAVHTSGIASISHALLEIWFGERYLHEHPHDVARYRAVLEKCSVDGYASCCAAIRDYDARPELAAIRVPTLVIAGTHDLSTPPVDGHFIADHVPGARYVELDAAHISNVERPAEFLAALVGHLTA